MIPDDPTTFKPWGTMRRKEVSESMGKTITQKWERKIEAAEKIAHRDDLFVAKFLLRKREGREHLGKTFSSRGVNDAASRALVRAVAFALPTEKRLSMWGKTDSPTCLLCGGKAETFSRMQLQCPELHGVITKAHDKAFEAAKAVIEPQNTGNACNWAQRAETEFPELQDIMDIPELDKKPF